MARPTDIYERVTGRQLYLVAEFDDSPLNHGKRITDAHMRHERGGNFLLYRFDSIAYKLYKLKALIYQKLLAPSNRGFFIGVWYWSVSVLTSPESSVCVGNATGGAFLSGGEGQLCENHPSLRRRNRSRPPSSQVDTN